MLALFLSGAVYEGIELERYISVFRIFEFESGCLLFREVVA